MRPGDQAYVCSRRATTSDISLSVDMGAAVRAQWFFLHVDYLQLQGYLRWSLILLFMFLKAGFIVAIFMHMAWERMALITAILLPPIALLFFIAFMAIEGDYIFAVREFIFSIVDFVPQSPHH